MFGLGVTEILLILALLVLVFGASRLPKIARGLGEGIRNFKGEVKAGRDEPPPLPPGSSESERTSGGGDAAGS